MEMTSAYFWRKIESGVMKIPSYIKHGLTMAGYCNPVIFIDLTDEDIKATEKYIRTKTLNVLQKKLNESMNIQNGDVLLDDEILVEYFGETYANDSENFEFLPGDVKLIKYLATHVEMLLEGKRPHKDLKSFCPPKTRKRKPSNQPSNSTQTIAIKVDKIEPMQENSKQNEERHLDCDNEAQRKLKSTLFQKIMDCLQSFNANQFVDLENVGQDIVTVHTENGKIFGTVECVICRNETGEDVQAKKVSYHSGENSQYWIPSNFTTHLKKVHKLSGKNKKTQQATEHTTSNKKMKLDFNNDESVVLIPAEPVQSNYAQNDSQFWFDQITNQVTAMTANVLTYNEQQLLSILKNTTNHLNKQSKVEYTIPNLNHSKAI